MSRGIREKSASCRWCPARRGEERGQHAFLAVYSDLATSPLTLLLSPSLFLSFLSGSHDLYASEREKEREIDRRGERRAPKRCDSETPDVVKDDAGGGGGEDRRRSRPRTFRPVRSPFFHDATRPRGRRSHEGEALAATFPGYHSRSNNNHRRHPRYRDVETWPRRAEERGYTRL